MLTRYTVMCARGKAENLALWEKSYTVINWEVFRKRKYSNKV